MGFQKAADYCISTAVRWFSGKEVTEKPAETCGESLRGRGHLRPSVRVSCSYVFMPLVCLPYFGNCVHFSAYSAQGCSKVHRKEKNTRWGWGDSFMLARSKGCFPPSTLLFSLSLSLVHHDTWSKPAMRSIPISVWHVLIRSSCFPPKKMQVCSHFFLPSWHWWGQKPPFPFSKCIIHIVVLLWLIGYF